MDSIRPKTTIGFTLDITLTEQQARALDGLTGYEMDTFLKLFYVNLGRAYLEPHEEGLRSLFDSIRRTLPPFFAQVDVARKAFNEKKP